MTQVSSPQNISKRWLTAVFGRFVHVVPRSRNGTVVMTIIVIAASVIMTTVRELVKVNATTSLWERRVPWAISQLQNGAITWERLIYATAPILISSFRRIDEIFQLAIEPSSSKLSLYDKLHVRR